MHALTLLLNFFWSISLLIMSNSYWLDCFCNFYIRFLKYFVVTKKYKFQAFFFSKNQFILPDNEIFDHIDLVR